MSESRNFGSDSSIQKISLVFFVIFLPFSCYTSLYVWIPSWLGILLGVGTVPGSVVQREALEGQDNN